MDSGQLVQRMKDYFARQIDWFEQMLVDLDTIEDDLNDPDLERLTRQGRGHAVQTTALEKEFRALQQEWEALTGITETERAEVRTLAQRAGALAHRLCAIHDRATGLARRRADQLEASLNEIQRGRELLRTYGGDRSTAPAFVDRSA